MSRSHHRQLAVLAAILAVYLLLLGQTVSYGFVWDDVHEIENNEAFDLPLSASVFHTQTERTNPALTELPTIELAYDSFRPLLFTSLWIDVQFWGRSPAALHAVNVLFGAIAILLAYALALRWIGGSLALIPTALFALHPIQIEAVAYISGRGDVLAGLLALLASVAAFRAIDSPARGRAAAWGSLAAASFAGSLLSKETCVALPIVIAAIALFETKVRTRWWVPAILAVVVAGYLVLRAAIVTTTTGHTVGAGVLALPGIWIEYLRIIALPFDLSTERLRQPGYAIPGAAISIAMLVTIAVAAKQRAVGKDLRTAFGGLLWMTVLVAPAAIPIVSSNVVADRYFYLPILGLGIAITAGASCIPVPVRFQWPLAICGVLSSVMWLLVAWRQVPVWKDNQTLYAHAAEMTPESSMAQYRVGYLDAQASRWDSAILRFERAIELDARNLVALNNLGVSYLRSARYEDAARVLAKAVEVNPAHFRAWLNLGLAQWSLGERVRGCASIVRALTIHPGYSAAAEAHRQRCVARPTP